MRSLWSVDIAHDIPRSFMALLWLIWVSGNFFLEEKNVEMPNPIKAMATSATAIIMYVQIILFCYLHMTKIPVFFFFSNKSGEKAIIFYDMGGK